ncbi:putative ATPase, AAA-type, core, peptidase M41, FtsH extracellular [Medicago truncatula]|uniref:ATP-dependent zinc metalloprotease FTSH-like protein n=1 Tax=Medicago truncatula TaxID=3880 RepID=A0A072U7X6_MEDTR|nr:probable inactive ATP-dependent zinc metalloprotease FTSHI 3, chloroplastic [Medicago truncatula]KEH25238.1 ATP-dependent zinc metalloprotease FTSH-like protein [Medicago truncatula]RHN50338.1 putative ATPase, AAA-type, core, peptidase M41, FtsH extracellular [Medicago truncatula]
MACFSLPCCTGSFLTPNRLKIKFNQCYNFENGFLWNKKFEYYGRKSRNFSLRFQQNSVGNEIEPLVSSRSRDDRKSDYGKGGRGNRLKKRFSLRLRPRLRLLVMRMKRASVESVFNEVGVFVRKNIRTVAFATSFSIVFTLCFLFLKFTSLPPVKMVPYSDLIASLRNGNVEKVLVEEGSRRIYYNTVSDEEESQQVVDVSMDKDIDEVVSENAVKSGGIPVLNKLKKFSKRRASVPEWQYSTRKIDHDEKFLLSLMREKEVTFSSAPQSVLAAMRGTLITVITLWIPLIPLMWVLYRQLSAANSPAKKRKPKSQTVGFEDVQGVDSAKVELMEIVSCLQGDINYQKLGAKLPRGVLLVGPPGTGKTLLARAVAGEAGVPFFTVSASEFVEMFVGRGAARIRDLFSRARKFAPSIIFIDELDAVGGKRGRGFNEERDQTLNQLLTEMDGFESEIRVVVIAATNRPEALDPALCRPGRFSRKVFVGEPDEEGRRKILAVHLRGVPLEEDANIICHLIATVTDGLVGADLANIVNESALLAARRGSETVAREDIIEAIERAKFGINDKQLRSSKISKELGKLFPWMPSLMGRSDRKQDDIQGPLGYQSLNS